MEQSASKPFAGCFSILFMVAVTGWLLILHKGQLASEQTAATLALLSTLTCVHVAYLTLWKNHSLGLAVVVSIIVLVFDRQPLESSSDGNFCLSQAILLALYSCLLIIGSTVDQLHFTRYLWVIALVGLSSLTALIFIEAEMTSRLVARDAVSSSIHQRMRQCSFVLLIVAAVGGLVFAKGRSKAVWFGAIVCLLAPILGYALARLYVPAHVDHLLDGARWDLWYDDLRKWSAAGNHLAAIEPCCWTTPWIVVALWIAGFWRTISRGVRQRRRGALPVAWLLSLAATLLVAVVLPSTTPESKPLGLACLAIILPVFGLADLGLLLGEQLALPTPAPGPSRDATDWPKRS